MIKTNIKMIVTPEQSRRVQEICFANGTKWNTGKKYVSYQHAPYLIILENKALIYKEYNQKDDYEQKEEKEIDADLFIKTNGTCEETYLTKYTSQPKDIESALKKIENLHIALNKKVEKNKNQALEITKLLEQKKDLQQQRINESKDYCDLKKEIDDMQEINDTQNKYIKELENRLNQLNSSGATTNDTMNNYVDDLHIRLKEKDIIISYLESKLK